MQPNAANLLKEREVIRVYQEHSIFKHIDWTCTLALFYIQYLTYLANSKKVEFALQLFLGNQQESRDCNLTRPDSACSGDHNDDDDDDDDDGEIRQHMYVEILFGFEKIAFGMNF